MAREWVKSGAHVEGGTHDSFKMSFQSFTWKGDAFTNEGGANPHG